MEQDGNAGDADDMVQMMQMLLSRDKRDVQMRLHLESEVKSADAVAVIDMSSDCCTLLTGLVGKGIFLMNECVR